MKSERIKMRINKVFEDGKLIPAADRKEDITDECLFFPDDMEVTRVSIGAELPIKLADYQYAKSSVHISVPCPTTSEQIEEAKKFASNFCQSEVQEQMAGYLEWLKSKGIDMEKIAKKVK